MTDKEVGMVHFNSLDIENEGFAIVRIVKGNISICISLRNGGDTEVLISRAECNEFLKLLERTLNEC